MGTSLLSAAGAASVCQPCGPLSDQCGSFPALTDGATTVPVLRTSDHLFQTHQFRNESKVILDSTELCLTANCELTFAPTPPAVFKWCDLAVTSGLNDLKLISHQTHLTTRAFRRTRGRAMPASKRKSRSLACGFVTLVGCHHAGSSLHYTHQNPVRLGLVEHAEDFGFQVLGFGIENH